MLEDVVVVVVVGRLLRGRLFHAPPPPPRRSRGLLQVHPLPRMCWPWRKGWPPSRCLFRAPTCGDYWRLFPTEPGNDLRYEFVRVSSTFSCCLRHSITLVSLYFVCFFSCFFWSFEFGRNLRFHVGVVECIECWYAPVEMALMAA